MLNMAALILSYEKGNNLFLLYETGLLLCSNLAIKIKYLLVTFNNSSKVMAFFA